VTSGCHHLTSGCHHVTSGGQVDETRDKMRFAVNAMNKMMRKKDNGK
jgi:hypothetical protein